VTVKKSGTFPRLETTLFLLWGWPSSFSELVTYARPPTQYTGPGELLEHFCKQEVGAPIASLTIDGIHKFDYRAQVQAVRVRHGFHKFNGLTLTAFLLDVMTLFMASSLARYDVLGWREILDGRTNPYLKTFEESFRRYRDFTADALLRAIEDPDVTLKNNLIPSEASPYAGQHRRFGNDPNSP
jgi:hypothetical protein